MQKKLPYERGTSTYKGSKVEKDKKFRKGFEKSRNGFDKDVEQISHTIQQLKESIELMMNHSERNCFNWNPYSLLSIHIFAENYTRSINNRQFQFLPFENE